MNDRVDRLAQSARETARTQQEFEAATIMAGEWMRGAEGRRMPTVLLAASIVQAFLAARLGEEMGMSPRDVMANVSADMLNLADLTEGLVDRNAS